MTAIIKAIVLNQTFHYTRCNMPKRVTSLLGPYPSCCARATLFLPKKCCSGGELLVALCQFDRLRFEPKKSQKFIYLMGK